MFKHSCHNLKPETIACLVAAKRRRERLEFPSCDIPRNSPGVLCTVLAEAKDSRRLKRLVRSDRHRLPSLKESTRRMLASFKIARQFACNREIRFRNFCERHGRKALVPVGFNGRYT